MGGGGRSKEKGRWGKKPKTKQSPFPIPYPQVFEHPDLGVEKGVCWWGKGTLRQQTS